MLRLLILSALVAISFGGLQFRAACSLSNDGIINGDNTTIEDHPWQCSLQSNGNHWCGCSLIAWNRWLTAAHCTSLFPHDTNMTVRCGTATVQSGGVVIKVLSYKDHPNFSDEGIPQYDLSLLYLAFPVASTPKTKLISLPSANDVYQTGYSVNITGWGENSSSIYPEVLQVANLNVVENKECDKSYFEEFNSNVITDQMMCAGSQNKDKGGCYGDSGGPLNDITTLVGVVSWGNLFCNTSYPTVFARVSSMRDWIDSVLNV